jgi:hypothetical protein
MCNPGSRVYTENRAEWQIAAASRWGYVMAVISVTTLTVAPDRWEQFVEDNKKSKAILERHGARGVRLLAEVAGAVPSGTVHLTFEADSLQALGKIMDSVFADPDILAMMQSDVTVSWTGSILGEIPLS